MAVAASSASRSKTNVAGRRRRPEQSLDLNLLKVLVALHHSRSVTAAAAALELSQPATSLALKRLREAIGDPLFVRTQSGMQPTPRCAAIIGPARQALELVATGVIGESTFDPRTSRRRYVLNMNDVGEMALLPRLVRHFAQFAPHCDLRTEALPIAELADALESGRIDVALGYFPELNKAAIFRQRLFTRSFVCLVRTDHPRVTGDRIPLRLFLELGHVLVQPQGRSHDLFETVLRRQGLTRRIHLLVPHFMSVPAIVASTDLIVTVADSVAGYFGREFNLRVVRPPISAGGYSISQYWHSRFNHDAAIAWLRRETASLFQP